MILPLQTLFLSALLALPAPAARGQEEVDFRPLFDGTTLEGWRYDERYWRVEDGVIVGESTAAVPCDRSSYLLYEAEELGDFELRLSFRIDSGNSGVQVRSQRVGPYDVAGYQADIDFEGQHVGSFYEQFGRGVVARRGERALFGGRGKPPTTEVFADAEELRGLLRPGEWNELTVVAQGERLTIDLNGVRTAELVDRSPNQRAGVGNVAFQLHEGAPMRVAFRDVRVRELGPGDGVRMSTLPQWIWLPGPVEEDTEGWFKRDFEIAGDLRTARLFGSADNRMEVYLNGHLVALSEYWRYRFEVDVLDRLRQGTNTFTVWCKNEDELAGFWLELRGRGPGGLQRLATDETWSARAAEPKDWDRPGLVGDGWSAAVSQGPLGVQPWGSPRTSPRGTPDTALPAEELELAPGFRAELVYSVPQARLGSWVSLAVDERGRFLASDQIGDLHRVTLPEKEGEPVRVETLDVDLGAAQGLCFAFGALYVVVNDVTGRWEPGLYRLRDTDGDDAFDSVELLRALDGDGEHGPHAVVPGPDGESLYVIAGNLTAVPEAIARERARVVREPDGLLPHLDSPNWRNPEPQVSGGWVARTDPDGVRWEIVAVGLRNAYDLAFDEAGEPFTVDSDMEWDVGLPWYRAPRVVHLASGADLGWRAGSGKWDSALADSLAPVLEIGPASPTGVVFSTKLAFGPDYARTLFAADWSVGRILAVHLDRVGAGYGARVESFVRGTPLPVTDLVAGPDGALWFVTGGRGLKSALYRVSREEESASSRSMPPASGDAGKRRFLESFHGVTDAVAVEAAWPYLASADPLLRHAARIALESQEPARWSQRALAEEDPITALTAWLALARSGRAEHRGALLERIVDFPWAAADAALRLELVRILDRVLLLLGPPTGSERARIGTWLTTRFPSGDDRVDRALAALLVAVEAPDRAPLLLQRLTEASSREEEIHYAALLRLVPRDAGGWTVAGLRAYLAWFPAALERYSGGNDFAGYLEAIRAEVLDGLEPADREELGELAGELDIASARGDAGVVRRPEGPIVEDWVVAEILPAWEATRLAERDLARGAGLFERATCLDCHRVEGRDGGSEGPDLSHAGGRFGARDFLFATIEPSRTVSDQYRDTEVWTRDDRLFVGTVLAEDGESLTIRTRPPDVEVVQIAKEEVDLRRPTPLSDMPEGLLDTLELEEILDLVAYVLSLGR